MAGCQIKTLLDSTGGSWQRGALIGKAAGVFVSSSSLGRGQESTAWTFITQVAHHGMIFVPMGYGCPELTNMTEVHGGSPYGAGTVCGSGKGSRLPSKLERDMAVYHGKMFGDTVMALMCGRAAREKLY